MLRCVDFTQMKRFHHTLSAALYRVLIPSAALSLEWGVFPSVILIYSPTEPTDCSYGVVAYS